MNATTEPRIDIDAAIAAAKEQVLADITNGLVPLGLKSSGDTDGYADPNRYGFAQFVEQVGEERAKESLDLLPEVWSALNCWLRRGGHFIVLRERGVLVSAKGDSAWLRELAALLRIQGRVTIQ
jgi:hypothetical protein